MRRLGIVCLFFADLGALGNYPGSPFLHSDSEILLDSPEHDDIGNGNCIYCIFRFIHRLSVPLADE